MEIVQATYLSENPAKRYFISLIGPETTMFRSMEELFVLWEIEALMALRQALK